MEASIFLRFFVLGCLSQIVSRTGKIMQETNLDACVQTDSITSLGYEFGYFKGSDLAIAAILAVAGCEFCSFATVNVNRK